MGTEIEKKFLPKNNDWKQLINKSRKYCYQGYLSKDKDRTVRIRTMGDEGFITVKGLTEGISRSEFEYEIPYEDAQMMLNKLCLEPLIEKERITIPYDGFLIVSSNISHSANWEIDVFKGRLEGLVLIEIEVPHEDTEIILPDWIGEDVSNRLEYYNSNL